MDIACPNCDATYRLKIELSATPKALKCAACGHVFGAKRAADAGEEPPAPPRRVTGEINPELKQMAADEAKLRSKLREQDQASAADAEPKAEDSPDAKEPPEPSKAEAAAENAATTPEQPKAPEAKAKQTEAPAEKAQQADLPKEETQEKTKPAEAEKATPKKANAPKDAEAFEAIMDEPILDSSTDDGQSDAKKRARNGRMGLMGVVFWAALILGGIASGVNQFAPAMAEAWPQLAAPLAAFQADFASALGWIQAQWANIVEAVQGLQT